MQTLRRPFASPAILTILALLAAVSPLAAQQDQAREDLLDSPKAQLFKRAIFQYQFGNVDVGRKAFEEFMDKDPSPELAAALVQEFGDDPLKLMSREPKLARLVKRLRDKVDEHRQNIRELKKDEWALEAMRKATMQYRIGNYEETKELLDEVAGYDLTPEQAYEIRRTVGYEAIVGMSRAPEGVELTDAQGVLLQRIGARVSAFLAKASEHVRNIKNQPETIRTLVAELDGDAQQVSGAVRDLLLAGEFAVPHLVEAIKGAATPRMVDRYHATLRALGERAVMPLMAALEVDSENVRLTAAAVLGELKDQRAAAALKAIYDDDATDAGLLLIVKRALGRLGYDNPEAMPPAGRLYLDLAEMFYYGRPVTQPTEFEEVAPVWRVVDNALEPRMVPVNVYGVEYAERFLVERSNTEGVTDAWWRLLACTLEKKKLLLGDGAPEKTAAIDRTLGVGGLPLVGQALMRPLEDNDADLSVLMIDHLDDIVQGDPAGCKRLEELGSIEAALYAEAPLVRWVAARTVAANIAGCDFRRLRGSDRVLAMLDEAIWAASTDKTAIVATGDDAQANRLRQLFVDAELPYTVEPVGDLEDARARAAAMPLPDVVVIDSTLLPGRAGRAFEAPTVVVAPRERIVTLRGQEPPAGDQFVLRGVTEVGLADAVQNAVATDAPDWALGYTSDSISRQAAEALQKLARQDAGAVVPIVPSLNRALESTPVTTAISLADTMGRVAMTSSLAPLRRVALDKDADKSLRLAAIRAIGNIVAANPEADGLVLDDLKSLLDSNDADIHTEAAEAIGKGGYPAQTRHELMRAEREAMTY